MHRTVFGLRSKQLLGHTSINKVLARLKSGSSKPNGGGSRRPDPFASVSPYTLAFGPIIPLLGCWLLVAHLNGRSKSKEITWQQFRNNFLASGAVERLLIVDCGTHVTQVHFELRSASAAKIDINSVASSSNQTRSHEQIQGVRGQAAGSAKPEASDYFFTIGTVEHFEQQFQLAQTELGRSPSQFIPVQYVAPEARAFDAALSQASLELLYLGGVVLALHGLR